MEGGTLVDRVLKLWARASGTAARRGVGLEAVGSNPYHRCADELRLLAGAERPGRDKPARRDAERAGGGSAGKVWYLLRRIG